MFLPYTAEFLAALVNRHQCNRYFQSVVLEGRNLKSILFLFRLLRLAELPKQITIDI